MSQVDKKRALSLLAAKLNKERGENTAVLASAMRDPQRITSGSLAFDAALGGGWPVNQWHEILGETTAGKTCTVLQTLAANQRLDPEFICVWLAAEYFDAGYAQMIGVDVNRVLVVNENVMEEAYQAVLEALEGHACDMLVIDSYPALSPSDEIDKDMEESTMALGARFTNKFFRKVGTSGKRSMVDETERACTCFFINQFRDKIGVMYGDPRTSPGGKGKNYSCYTQIEIKRDDWIDVGPRTSRQRVGQTIKMKVIKNKSFPPQKVATVDFYFEDIEGHHAGEYDRLKETVGLGVVHGLIRQAGAWFSYEGMRTQGLPAMVEALTEVPEVFTLLQKQVLAEAVSKPYKPLEEPPAIEVPVTPAKAPAKRTVARKAVSKK